MRCQREIPRKDKKTKIVRGSLIDLSFWSDNDNDNDIGIGIGIGNDNDNDDQVCIVVLPAPPVRKIFFGT